MSWFGLATDRTLTIEIQRFLELAVFLLNFANMLLQRFRLTLGKGGGGGGEAFANKNSPQPRAGHLTNFSNALGLPGEIFEAGIDSRISEDINFQLLL